MFDIMGVQEAARYRDCTELAGKYTFFYCGKGTANYELGTDFFVQKRIISAVKIIEFVSDGLP
jgi:hypothetical protein